MSKLLVVDDEPHVAVLLRRLLGTEGHSVFAAHDGVQGLDAMAAEDFDLVLLDVMMPRMNGLQTLAEVRRRGLAPVPVIVLSGVDEVAARVQALDLGAVDFVQKPFVPVELRARVRRHLVRVPQQRSPEERYLTIGGISLDLDRRRAVGPGFDVSLTEREFSLLSHLMRRAGSVCGKQELLHDIWGLGFDPGSNVIEVCVRRLRSKLGEPPIETVRGVGYCFVAA